MIKENSLVLFQGDSITDWGRNREDFEDLGTGYALMTAAWIGAFHPELNLRFLNRGIGFNRSNDLKQRWQSDCIDLKPDVVSILVGVNDTLRKFDENSYTSPEQYRENYYYLLSEIKEKLNAQIILCEPFLIAETEAQKKLLREDLDPKIHIVRELAREFNAVYVPFDGMFAAAAIKHTPEYWSLDGIHPTKAGHALMSKMWMESVGLYK